MAYRIEHMESEAARIEQMRAAMERRIYAAKSSDEASIKGDTLKPQFDSAEALQKELQRRFDQTMNTYGDKLPKSEINKWIENKEISLSRVASQADKAGFLPQETGTLVHRVAELRTLTHHQSEVLRGIRSAELPISSRPVIGESGADATRVELDLVTVRGDTHYIHDFKPINLAGIEKQPWADQFKQWLDKNCGGDVGQLRGYKNMDPELRTNFHDFMRDAVAKHKGQLADYCQQYAEARGLSFLHVKPSVLPYFVWR